MRGEVQEVELAVVGVVDAGLRHRSSRNGTQQSGRFRVVALVQDEDEEEAFDADSVVKLGDAADAAHDDE